MELAKAAYHLGKLHPGTSLTGSTLAAHWQHHGHSHCGCCYSLTVVAGIHALEQAIKLSNDQQSIAQWIGMLCDLHYYTSRTNGSALADVARCVDRQAAAAGSAHLDSKFWAGFSVVLVDIGRTDEAVGALRSDQPRCLAIDLLSCHRLAVSTRFLLAGWLAGCWLARTS